MNQLYHLERLKKVEYLRVETSQEYIMAQARNDVEAQARSLLKLGELELEAQELTTEMFKRLAGDGVVWREGEERQEVDD